MTDTRKYEIATLGVILDWDERFYSELMETPGIEYLRNRIVSTNAPDGYCQPFQR